MSEISIDPNKTICPECGSDKVVLDYHVGDLICTNCGVVLEGRCIDDGQEWRTFADEGAQYGQKVSERERADKGAAHDMMSDDISSTGITGSSTLAKTLQRAQQRQLSQPEKGSNPARNEAKALNLFCLKVRETAGRLALGEGIVNRCVGLYQDLVARGEMKKGQQAAWYCAIVHIASVQERATRTIAELAEANAAVAGKRTQADFEKQIDKKVKQIYSALDLTQATAYIEDEELMARFVSRLGLSSEVTKPASHICQEAYRCGLVGKQPQTAIVASSIFVIAYLLGVEAKPSFADVAGIAKVSEAAVRSAYKPICSHIRRLLPKDFKSRMPLEALATAISRDSRAAPEPMSAPREAVLNARAGPYDRPRASFP